MKAIASVTCITSKAGIPQLSQTQKTSFVNLCNALTSADIDEAHAAEAELVENSWALDQKAILTEALALRIGAWQPADLAVTFARMLRVAARVNPSHCCKCILERLLTHKNWVCGPQARRNNEADSFVTAVVAFYVQFPSLLPSDLLLEYLRDGVTLSGDVALSLVQVLTFQHVAAQSYVPMYVAIGFLYDARRIESGGAEALLIAKALVSARPVAFWAREIKLLTEAEDSAAAASKAFLKACFFSTDPIMLVVMHANRAYLVLREEANGLKREKLFSEEQMADIGAPIEGNSETGAGFFEDDPLETLGAFETTKQWRIRRAKELLPPAGNVFSFLRPGNQRSRED